MKTRIGMIMIVIVVGLCISKTRDEKANAPKNQWSESYEKRWMSDCIEVTMSELEDGKGNHLSSASSKKYCECMFAGLKANQIQPKDEGDFISKPTWLKLSKSCYSKSNAT